MIKKQSVDWTLSLSGITGNIVVQRRVEGMCLPPQAKLKCGLKFPRSPLYTPFDNRLRLTDTLPKTVKRVLSILNQFFGLRGGGCPLAGRGGQG